MAIRSNPKALEVIAARLKELDGVQAKAGFFQTSKYEDGTPVAYVATIQEFGVHINRYGSKAGDYTIVIPPRPFMRPTAERERQNWIDLMASGAKAIVKGTETGISVMEAIGLKAAGDIAKSISQVTTPPLEAATIAARRRRLTDKKTIGLLEKPLVDTGLMINSVTNVVESVNGEG